MLKYLAATTILQALVIQQTIAWGVLRVQPLLSSATGKEIPIDTLKQRLQFFQKSNISENPNYNEYLAPGESCQYTNSDARNVVTSIKATLKFYQDYSLSAIPKLESATGLMTLKGNLLHAKNIIDKTMPNSEFSKQLNHLFDTSSKLISNSILGHSKKRTAREANIADDNYVRADNADIWAGPIGAWKSFDISLKYQHQFSNIGDEVEVIDNYKKYKCLSTLMNNCDVPSVCQTAYLEKAYSQHMLTHQVLFLHLAEGKSCMTEEKNVGKFKDWEQFREQLCGKVFQEANFIAKNGFSFALRDLFTEQIRFCGIAGFPNFMRIDWLNEILSWQSKGAHGCFKDIYGEIQSSDVKVKTTTITTSNASGEPFEETCLAHFTAEAFSVVATHLRYMFDTCSPDIFKDVLF